MDLKDKTAFVTGGAMGIGQEYVRSLLSQGVKVVFGDINAKAGETTAKRFGQEFGEDSVKFIPLDVTNQDQYQIVFQTAVEHLGCVDIMINNAGILNEGAGWQRVVDINLTAMIFGTKLAIGHMRKDRGGKGGRIISTLSVLGLEQSFSSPVYSGTKHGLRAYLTSMAQDPTRPDQGIQYAMIAPDVVNTQMVQGIDNSTVNGWDQIKGFVMNRRMSPRTIGEALIHLLSLDVINGAILHVDAKGRTFRHIECVNDGLTFDPSKTYSIAYDFKKN
ncbi:15-hydroxyprostaglandin dehydrogenase [NAD(+)]-like [Aplysia californica]|uniref:15-hydroxyprostaglandin dehydrogenase [NAD(+)] n=1 Tax=Aplysia californica TaxID=6500 RepID=A0ABM1A7N6_APLCA|nr:15-hydroxyprostaglandin dehydrogenase [NAD(+)]-like [Aplysia californica]